MATQVQNRRLIRDNSLTITKALPGTSASNTSGVIDLGTGPFNPEEITIEILIPAIAAHVTSGNVPTITLWASDTTTVTTATDPVISTSWIGVASTGSTGKTISFKLPPGTKRYIAFRQTAGATDDLSGSTITYSVLS